MQASIALNADEFTLKLHDPEKGFNELSMLEVLVRKTVHTGSEQYKKATGGTWIPI